MLRRSLGLLIIAATAAGTARAQTNIDPAHKSAWGENIGWLNWHDANGGADAVRVHATFMGGFAWAENVGWLNLGGGRPANGTAYANANATDFGVNIDPSTGNLFGLAWGENIGWLNFDTRTALGPNSQQARLDYVTNRFRGYAWGENVGWINLDDATRYAAYVPTACRTPFADTDGDGDGDQDDFGKFQACLSGANRPAPYGCECFDRPETGFPHGDNDVDLDDLAKFVNCISGPHIPLNPACAN